MRLSPSCETSNTDSDGVKGQNKHTLHTERKIALKKVN